MTISCRIFRVLALAALLVSGCATYRPWLNTPLPPSATTQRLQQPPPQPVMVAVTLSGGGARAAAFGLGVLRELKATQFAFEGGRSTTLLDETVLISGVSGGSILAAHYAAFGDATLAHFESDFLLVPFERRLIYETLWPTGLYALTSPWYGRSHLLAERLDLLYQGKTFADVHRRPGAPELMITATDLTTGAPFDFTPHQFQLICSDLGATPLSFAVAASSAVPILLSPMTVRNYAGQCPSLENGVMDARTNASYRTRILQHNAQSYTNATERPYIHLVDGGVTDNLGARLLLDKMAIGGSISANFPDAPPGTIRRLVLVTVNSERGLAERVDKSDRTPTTLQVLESLIFGAGTKETRHTLAMLNEDLLRWRDEIRTTRGLPGSPFADDAEVHAINVSLQDLEDDDFRHNMLRVPTAFSFLLSPRKCEICRERELRHFVSPPRFKG